METLSPFALAEGLLPENPFREERPPVAHWWLYGFAVFASLILVFPTVHSMRVRWQNAERHAAAPSVPLVPFPPIEVEIPPAPPESVSMVFNGTGAVRIHRRPVTTPNETVVLPPPPPLPVTLPAGETGTTAPMQPVPFNTGAERVIIPPPLAPVPVPPANMTPEQKRQWIRTHGGKGLLKIMPAANSGAMLAEPTGPDNHVGMYLTYNSMKRNDFVQKTIDDTVKAGGNAIVFEVKGGNVHYQTTSPMANKIGTAVTAYDLPAFIAKARQQGIFTIGRFVTVKDPLLAQYVPGSRIKNPKNGTDVGQVWTDPAAPDTLQYNKEILVDLLKSGIDEVNFDYIRYPTEYDQRLIGLNGDGKADHIETFLRMVKEERDAISPHTKIGISTYAIMGWDYEINKEMIGQDFVRFAPLVDIISPMAYPASFTSPEYYVPGRNVGSRMYSLVYRTLKGYADRLGPEESKKIRPWIQAYYVDSQDVYDEIKAVYDAGSCGFMFWSAGNTYGASYAGLKQAAVLKPERCK
jgi:hypothetical protein